MTFNSFIDSGSAEITNTARDCFLSRLARDIILLAVYLGRNHDVVTTFRLKFQIFIDIMNNLVVN